MMMIKRSLHVLLILLTIFCGLSNQVTAEPNRAKELARLQQLGTKIQATQEIVRKIEAREDSVTAELETIELKYGETSKTLEKLTTQTIELKEKLTQIRTQKAKQQKVLLLHHKNLANQLRAAYRSGRQKQWRVLLSQNDPSKMARHMVYYRHLNQARRSQINVVQSLLTDLQQVEANAVSVKLALASTRQKIQTDQAELLEIRKTRTKILTRLQQKVKSQKNTLSDLIKDQKKLQRLITSISQSVKELNLGVLNKQPFSQLKGKLPWPVKTYSSYQRRVLNDNAQGIIINTSEGTLVRAVAHGRVVFSDWMPSYGLMIIIDHGSSYLTLYAYNQNLKTALGRKVNAGEIIASAGASGGRSESAVYFEIRKSKQQYNPLRWLSKDDKK
ncbi:MAG: peptidoglycan DD-metalloendopeptidase family protein [Methylococcales bacterium]